MKKKAKESRPLVTFCDVTLQVGDRRVFEHVDWSIRSDEHWAIVGPNGSGKSLLARALHGSVAVVGGEIEYYFDAGGGSEAGASHDRAPEDLIAHVSFEDQRDFVSMSPYYQSRWNSIEGDDSPTVSDIVSAAAVEPIAGGLSVGRKKSRRSREGILDRLGIGSLLHRKVIHLSNGEMRKVLIAEALLQSPLILILDDPFVGLDYRSRRTLRKMIENLMKGAMRIVFVTSRIDEMPSGLTHVLRVEDGRIVAAGDRRSVLPSRLLKKPSAGKKRKLPTQRRQGKPSARVATRRSTLIDIKDASVVYGGTEVLKGIDWTVRDGQNWALLGPNGSGKTTLLSLILADNPQAYLNDIHLFGRKRGSGESIWDIKKKIGWVSPEIQIHYQKSMTCYDVVCSGFFDSIGLYMTCSDRQRRLVSGWIRDLGLSDLAERRFDELSSGQQRMILIARALVKNPRLLILDEPCQGLDIDNRQTVLDVIDAVGRETATNLIYVTHRLEEIPRSITHVLRLRNGRVVRKGERRSVLGK